MHNGACFCSQVQGWVQTSVFLDAGKTLNTLKDLCGRHLVYVYCDPKLLKNRERERE